MALHGRTVVAILPALNEEQAVGHVVRAMPSCIDHVIVCDNGSTDATASVAREAGAIVVHEAERGYGAACLRAMAHASTLSPDVVIFVDADLSDDPADIQRVLEPVALGTVDLMIGSRTRGARERGALTPQQVFGNWLATTLIRLRWGVRFSDLGPMRAITWAALSALHMRDRTFGWTVEMQIKAVRDGWRCDEIPVSYRRRVGTSKVSGTVKGTIMAGIIILSTIARYAIR
jgi:glycosyltransferase involved in cell wall biosynthesis